MTIVTKSPGYKLLASADTVEGIQECINSYWVSKDYRVDPRTLAITHPRRDPPAGVRVIHKGGRYRFERIVP